MAKTTGDQEIPSELMYPYEAVLRPQGALGRAWVYMRYPFGLPTHRKDKPGVSAKQVAQREIFEKSVRCYNCQPYTGGCTPPCSGPRNRSYWFDEAVGTGLWYFDYFMQQTMNKYLAGDKVFWCVENLLCMQDVSEGNPDQSFCGFYAQSAGVGVSGSRRYIYFKRQGLSFTHLEVLFQAIWGTGAPPYSDVTVRFHEVYETFNCVLLTWNNRPAMGPAVGSYVVPYSVGYKLMYIPIPVKTEWFAISVDETADYSILYLRGRDPVLENGWAYMVP